MPKIQIRCAAQLARKNAFFGFKSLYNALVRLVEINGDFDLTESHYNADLQISITLPDSRWEHYPWYAENQHPKQFIYTAWETTRFPPEWIRNIRRYSIGVIVPSRFCYRALRRDMPDIPIYIIPHGIWPDKFNYIQRNFYSEPFYFLWQGMHPNDRKGLIYFKEAYNRIYAKYGNKVAAIEKIYPVASKEYPPMWLPNNVLRISMFMSFKDYLDMLRQSHVSVNPYRGEGFGLMPLETAATGMPTMVTGFSGPMEYAKHDSFLKIKYNLSKEHLSFARMSPYVDFEDVRGRDAVPTVDDIEEKMLNLFHNRDYAERIGKDASEYVLNNWTWQHIYDKYFKPTIEEILDV